MYSEYSRYTYTGWLGGWAAAAFRLRWARSGDSARRVARLMRVSAQVNALDAPRLNFENGQSAKPAETLDRESAPALDAP